MYLKITRRVNAIISYRADTQVCPYSDRRGEPVCSPWFNFFLPTIKFLVLCLCTSYVLAAESFPPLVAEGEQLANNPQELAELFNNLSRRSEVFAIAFSPNGRTLVAGYDDGIVRLWNVATGTEVKRFEGHTERVWSVAFDPNGKTLASGSEDNTVRIWNIATGVEQKRFTGHTAWISSVAYSPNGQTLASASGDKTVRMWDIATGMELRQFQGHTGPVFSVAYSPDGKMLASSSHDKTIRLWDIATGIEAKLLEGHTYPVLSVAYSPDGQTLASGSVDSSVRVWDTATGTELKLFDGYIPWRFLTVAYSPDGQTLVAGSEEGNIRVWDLVTGTELKQFKGYSYPVWSVAYSPDGKTLASGSSDKSVRVWDVANAKTLVQLEGHTPSIWSIAYSPTGDTLAVGTDDNSIRIWDIATGVELKRFEGHTLQVRSIAYSPDGKMLASGSDDKTVRLWDIASCTELKQFAKNYTTSVRSVAYSPDGTTLTAGYEDGSVWLWDIKTASVLQQFKGHTASVWSVAYSPDGKTLASGSSDTTILIWDIATGSQLQQLNGHLGTVLSVAYSPDGKTIASGSRDSSIRLWDIASGTEVKYFMGHTNSVRSIAFSPDGQTLVSGSMDSSVRVWDIANSIELQQLEGHSSWVLAVAYSPNGQTLASASWDGSVQVWSSADWHKQWFYIVGQNGTWLSCKLTGKCWRYDDGKLARQRDEFGEFSPILPPSSKGQLVVTKPANTLQIEEAKLQKFTLTLQNNGQEPLYWLNVSAEIIRDQSKSSPLLFYSPKTIVTLEPNATVNLPIQVSAQADYVNPRGGYTSLDLRITSAYGKPMFVQIPVQTLIPSLQLEEIAITEPGEPLLISLRNTGNQDLTKMVFTGQLAKTKLNEIRHDTFAAGELLVLPFPVGTFKKMLKSKVHLTFTARKNSYPLHRWTFPNQPITLPQPSWYSYLLQIISLLVIVLTLLYYWRVFRHPLVVSLSQFQCGLSEVPIEQLPAVHRRLQLALTLQTILDHQQIPRSRWQTALQFSTATTAKTRCQMLKRRLGIKEISGYQPSTPWLFILNLGDQFVLRIERCVLAFPPAELAVEEIVAALQQVQTQQVNVCVIISTDIEQYTQLVQLQRDIGQSIMMWVVPQSRDLTNLLLSAPTQTSLEFARLIASQAKVTRISPYQTHGGVKKAAMFFGREQLLTDILSREPRNYLLIGARQLGKTSLLHELQRHYQQQPQVNCFYLSASRANLLQSLRRLAHELGLPKEAALTTVLAHFSNPPQGQRYILLIDETDDFIRTEAQNDYATLHILRNLSEEGRCHFILAGFWELYYAASLDYQSPVKNFGETLRIGALETDACRNLATQPMAALNISYAHPELVELIIKESGRRANLVAILCHEILQILENRRVIEATDIKRALDSREIYTALGGWGNLAGKKSRLDRIIVYATIEQKQFSATELWQQLDALDFVYQPEQVNESLARLELAFILKREKDQYSYRVPLFYNLLKTQGTSEMLTRELELMAR